MMFYEPSIFHDKISILDQFEALKQYVMGFDPGTQKPDTSGDIKELEFDITNFTESRALGDIYITYSNNETAIVPFKFPFMVSGSDTIVVDVNEDGTKLEIHLDAEIVQKLEKMLVIPEATPTETVLVAIDNTGKQILLKLGAGLKIANGEIVVTDEITTTVNLYDIRGDFIRSVTTTSTPATLEWAPTFEPDLVNGKLTLNGEILFDNADNLNQTELVGLAAAENTTTVAIRAGEDQTLIPGNTYTYYIVCDGDYAEVQFAIDTDGVPKLWRAPDFETWGTFAMAFSNDTYTISNEGTIVTNDENQYNVLHEDGSEIYEYENLAPGVYYVTTSAAPKETITFTVNNQEFTVDSGTTWNQWVTDTGSAYGYTNAGGRILGPIFREQVEEDGVAVSPNEAIDYGNYHETSYIAANVKDIKINNNTYQYIDGMTWAQWITTGFNSRPFYILDGMISLDREYDEEGQALVLKYWENYQATGAVLPSDKMDNTRQTVRKWVYQSGAPSTKETFYIDDIAYKKLPGVLGWEEWVNSSDNTGGFRIIADYYLVAKTWSTADDNGLIVCDEITETPVSSDGYFSGGSYITKMYY